MSRRSQRNRRAVNYNEIAADDEGAAEQAAEEQQQEKPADRGRRSRRSRATPQDSEEAQTLQPAIQRGDVQETEQLEEEAVEDEREVEQPQENAAEQPVAEKADSQETASDEMEVKDDAEQSDSDEEWSEEKPRLTDAGAQGREEAIVLSDDEVDDVFALTRPAHAARMKDARRETLSGHKKRPRAAASKKPSTLQPSSASSSSKRPLSQRSPVTVSKDDAILLEDSLDMPPARPPPSTATTPSAATSRPHPTAASSSSSSSRKPHKAVNSKLPFKPRSSSADTTDGPTSSQAANLASMRAILGPALPDTALLRFLVSANYNCERAISNILDSPQLLTTSHAATLSTSHKNRDEPVQPTAQQPTVSKKRSRDTSDVEEEENAEDEDEDDKRWFDKSTVKQPAADNEERKESEKEADKEEEQQAPILWDRKLLVVLRVEASCTTEGTRIVSLDESITFRDQSRDTYHQRMLRTQLQQQSQQPRNRKNTKQLRKDLRAERKKEHRILRFVPSAHLNALEIGTLPRAVSDVLVPLFDRRLIDLSAVVTAPCPVKFDLLSTIPLLLSVYALPALFQLKREVRVETKGFLGKVVSTAADQQLNPVDTFLALLSSFHIDPVSSSIRDEGNQQHQRIAYSQLPAICASLSLAHTLLWFVCVAMQRSNWTPLRPSTSRLSRHQRQPPRPTTTLQQRPCTKKSWKQPTNSPMPCTNTKQHRRRRQRRTTKKQ